MERRSPSRTKGAAPRGGLSKSSWCSSGSSRIPTDQRRPMQPRVDGHRLTFVLLVWLGGAAVCFAQDVARMDQVVQSYVSNGTFAGSVLVARGSHVIVSKGYGLAN